MGSRIGHWLFFHNPKTGTDIFESVDYIPTAHSSRVIATVIDGKTKSEARKTLEQLYDKVTSVNNSIFCRNVN